ncbi:styrene monooxygenase/indole monooxygenase family protein [Oricola sp.]|uniref:styrene monooxygenase/indole monooxygenase family protein n=1 Tax=Oricola sp. TaxID=1979950 RepID=UPI003BACBFB8
MSKIAIIGSGISGLVAGIGLLDQGHDVTIYSNLSAEDWLTKVPPTGTACRFASSIDLEDELGLNQWNDSTPINGVHLTFCPKPGRQLIDLMGRLDRPALAIDVRLQSHAWTLEFEKRGGKTVVTNVDIPALEEIAAAADLTLVAAGKADIGKLFEVDEARSVYDKPQRKLAMFVIRNVAMDRSDEGILMTHGIKFNFFGSEGEQFSVPYWHRDGYQCFNAIFEAKPGRVFDKFDDCKNGQDVLDQAKALFKEYIPWDYNWIKDAVLTDERGWLKGSVRPCYKRPVGTLPSGAKVMAVGDTANTLDPIGGQGANNCYRQIRVLLDEAKKNTDRDFSEAWMNATFDRYYEEVGKNTNAFNNILLEEITPAGIRLLCAQYGSTGDINDASLQQKIANDFVNNFDDPNLLTERFQDDAKARQYIDALSGGKAGSVDRKAKMSIALGQLRQVIGGSRSGHPLANPRLA